MSRYPCPLSLFVLLSCVTAVGSQDAAPVTEGVTFAPLRDHCARLLKAVAMLDGPLPPATVKELQRLLTDGAKAPEAAVVAIQKLLDPHCLIRVHVNPESRVKVARGPADAVLPRTRETFILIKVHNEAGVTHALTVQGPQLVGQGKTGAGGWLEAKVYTGPPLGKTLSGGHVEYVLLRLKAHTGGKREATLLFDVGQGTQDLGFRNEVPILFTVRDAKR